MQILHFSEFPVQHRYKIKQFNDLMELIKSNLLYVSEMRDIIWGIPAKVSISPVRERRKGSLWWGGYLLIKPPSDFRIKYMIGWSCLEQNLRPGSGDTYRHHHWTQALKKAKKKKLCGDRTASCNTCINIICQTFSILIGVVSMPISSNCEFSTCWEVLFDVVKPQTVSV